MDIFEITGYQTGVNKSGVNFLQPKDSFQNIINGFVYRQVLQSRQGFGFFAPRLANGTRVFGIFEHIHTDGTRELLAIDKNRLYTYNTGTGVFDLIPFAGSLAAYTAFGITSNEFYVSGTSYPSYSLAGVIQDRFVFVLQGGNLTPNNSLIFFYDGTGAGQGVKDYTSVADNPNYAAPTSGALTKARYVTWYNGRLNFIVPTLAGIDNEQAVLYSGIAASDGRGDKYNVPGSGVLQLDTYEIINGFNQLGKALILHLNRSNWVLETTNDVFNAYLKRKIPSVLGTDARFSSVAWSDIVKSIGKTGIIATDGRQSLRNDNKIPYFTADEIDANDFSLTYGGFDRINGQFLWAYKETEADTDTQNKVLVNNYEEETWSIYDQRFSVFGQTDLGIDLTWDNIDEAGGNDSWSQWDTTEEIWDKIGLEAETQKTLAGDDLGFIYNLNQDFDDYTTAISSITQAAQAVLTISEAAFQAGDLVTVQNVQGMTDINNFDTNDPSVPFVPWEVISATDTTVTLKVDSTNFAAATPNTGTISKVISFYAETIPFNPYREIGRRCFISHIEFLIDSNELLAPVLKVDLYQDEEETPYKSNVLCIPSTETNKARQWITVTVDNEANFHTIVMKQESPAVQLKITSVRIHCAPGGLTSG